MARELAYGEQRALEIGITLSTSPELILLDEPTAGMTREDTKAFIEMIDKVTRDLTLVIIEHDMDVVFSLATTLSVLHYGKILISGLPDDVMAGSTGQRRLSWGRPMKILDVQQLHSFYGKSHVIQGVSLQLDRGAFVCLLGRNGVGKTTTLLSIMGMVKPKDGPDTVQQ